MHPNRALKLTLYSMLMVLMSTKAFAASQQKVIAAAELAGLFLSTAQIDHKGELSQGVYHDLLTNILTDTGLWAEYTIMVLPMKRAKSGFLKKRYACYAPGLDTFDNKNRLLKDHGILVSKPFNHAFVRVASRSEDLIVSSIDDIQPNHTISIVSGVPANNTMRAMLDKAQMTFEVTGELANIQMLKTAHADHAMLFYPDARFAYQQMGISQPFPHDRQFIPLKIDETLICHDTYRKAFNTIQSALTQYENSGRLKQILGDYYTKSVLPEYISTR